MADLRGTETEDNLKTAFSVASQANRRYRYFAQRADEDGRPDIGDLFRSVAASETGHAFGHLDFLSEVGDPATGRPFDTPDESLRSAIASEVHEYDELYPGFIATAREEGFAEVAEWFEALVQAERSHAARFEDALEALRKT